MTPAPFRERLAGAIERTGAALCVGIDPDLGHPPGGFSELLGLVRQQTLTLVEATSPFAAAFKPNLAFFERLGGPGIDLLGEVVAEARRHAPVIADAKRGDIGNTARAYAEAIYDVIGADACTANPYLGGDALQPFLERPDRFVFVVCRSSNQGAKDFQDLELAGSGDPLYLEVARRTLSWDEHGNLGLVVGATWPRELARVREVAPTLPLLLPGVGAQQGRLEEAVAAAAGPQGAGTYLVAISRGISQAADEGDLATTAATAARDWRDRLAQAQLVLIGDPGRLTLGDSSLN